MVLRVLIPALAVVAAIAPPAIAQDSSEWKSLYDAHKWKDLYVHIRSAAGVPPLYRGAMGVAFHQDPEGAERLLLSVAGTNPISPEAYDAFEWLSHLYFYRGQYRKLVDVMERRWAAFPDKKERQQEEAEVAGFRGLPDQVTESSRASTLDHEPGSTFVSLSINGGAATYFLDTGAWISCMSESEANRLHLTINRTSGTIGQSAGSHVGFRTAVASDVIIGATHFKNVSFAVFPDDQEPWRDLAVGRRGIIGVPLLVGLQTVRWEKAGPIVFGNSPHAFDIHKANLVFVDDHLVISVSVEGKPIDATVDTGAVSTDLYQPFADRFENLLRANGKADTREVHGVGHSETFQSVTLPELRIQVGGARTVLSPAHVLLKSIGAPCCVGNFGMDLFSQTPVMEIDFGAMELRLLDQARP
jgi:predicted aspartyl protease